MNATDKERGGGGVFIDSTNPMVLQSLTDDWSFEGPMICPSKLCFAVKALDTLFLSADREALNAPETL